MGTLTSEGDNDAKMGWGEQTKRVRGGEGEFFFSINSGTDIASSPHDGRSVDLEIFFGRCSKNF